ncbi:hypothetical protein GGR54DRAFT_428931 [Hypoxylon sp. NC1633]|nr:hypothetical protein GGR54DRAFT_428931 [Hypoxylon sp. NC1633]
MKTASFVSILLGICLTGVQAELPYNMPEWRRDASPPTVPDHAKLEARSHEHHATGTGHHHHHHHSTDTASLHIPTTYIRLPGHLRHPPGTGTGTGLPYPTGHHHYSPAREYATFKTVTGAHYFPTREYATFKTVTGAHTGTHTGTGGFTVPTGHLPPPHKCHTKADCGYLRCPVVMSVQGPQCLLRGEAKVCACATDTAI